MWREFIRYIEFGFDLFYYFLNFYIRCYRQTSGRSLCVELVPEAAVHLNIKPEGVDDVITVPGRHGLCNPNNGFVPVFYLKDVQNELKLAFDTPVNSYFYGLLFEWLENAGMTELSSEEMEKAYKLAHLLQDKTIRYIRLVGTAIE